MMSQVLSLRHTSTLARGLHEKAVSQETLCMPVMRKNAMGYSILQGAKLSLLRSEKMGCEGRLLWNGAYQREPFRAMEALCNSEKNQMENYCQ
jgi:hypothetical protein